MELPPIKNTVTHPKTGVTYHVMAYRELTPAEMKQAILLFHSSKEGKKLKLKPGESLTIPCALGAND